MAERVYPSSKPTNNPPPVPSQVLNGVAAGATDRPPSFPPTKSQLYGASRPPYRPQPPKQNPRRNRRSRSRCCSCCLWTTLVLIVLIFLTAVAGCVFYFLYRPHAPSFSVSSLRLSALNLTASGQLSSRIDLNVTARNPNSKIAFLYDPTSVSVTSGDVNIGDGSFPAFAQEAKNTSVLLHAAAVSSGESVDAAAAADLMKKSSLPILVELETRAGVKIGALKTKRIGIRISCSGISVAVPKGKAGAAAASAADTKCKVRLRIKIWKWTF